ncbi:MAG: hypothetical protein Tsb009_20140 [Planctomycetaceae bacterium]
MLPNKATLRLQEQLIQQLGDSSYRRREAAMKQLVSFPFVSPALMSRALNGTNLEIRRRCQKVQKLIEVSTRRRLRMVYLKILEQGVRGLASEVLDSMTYCGNSVLVLTATRALCETATPRDLELLKHRLQTSSDATIRIAAIQAYEHLLGSNADDVLHRQLQTKNERIRLAVARAFANHGNRTALPHLVSLLSSEQLSVRIQAIQLLRQFTGRKFRFAPYDSKAARQVAVEKWKAWLKKSAAVAKLHYPLQQTISDYRRILVCDFFKHKLVELDLDGNVIEETPVGKNPWGIQRLSNGNRLVAVYSTRSVCEIDESGKRVWKITNLPGGPTSVERLPNGNTLVACSDSHRVVEINPQGNIIWNLRLAGRPTDAQRLENGRTLVTLQNANRVIEIDNQGKVYWSINNLAGPFSARRLKNGNTLVSSVNDGSAREYDIAKKLLRFQRGYVLPYDIQRFENGNTLIMHQQGITILDENWREIKLLPFKNGSKCFRY